MLAAMNGDMKAMNEVLKFNTGGGITKASTSISFGGTNVGERNRVSSELENVVTGLGSSIRGKVYEAVGDTQSTMSSTTARVTRSTTITSTSGRGKYQPTISRAKQVRNMKSRSGS